MLDHMFLDGLEDAYDKGRLMGTFAEDCAEAYQFTREAQDAFAISSLTRAAERDQGRSFCGGNHAGQGQVRPRRRWKLALTSSRARQSWTRSSRCARLPRRRHGNGGQFLFHFRWRSTSAHARIAQKNVASPRARSSPATTYADKPNLFSRPPLARSANRLERLAGI
ncbi:hypothetical protein VXQ18_16570 [Brucella abortus]|nr:hypothetical protein [Brucella abortus]